MKTLVNTDCVKGIVIRHLYEWRRDLDRVVDTFWWPIIDLLAWGLAAKYISSTNPQNENILFFFVGAVIFWSFMQNSQRDMNMPILSEAWSRNLINLFSTPLRLRELVLGSVILGLIKISISSLILFTLAYFIYGFSLLALSFFSIYAFFNLVLLGWSVGLLISGFIISFGYRVQSFAWAFIFILYPFSAVFYPVSVLPAWAQVVSAFVPSSYVFEGLRAVIGGSQLSGIYLLKGLLLNFVYILLSGVFLKLCFENSRRDGKLVKLN